MPQFIDRPCPCGSGLPSEEVLDARGIYVARVCDACRQEKLAGFRPEIFTDPSYDADEPIDAEESSWPFEPPF
ncbi:MAG TPA: hypothetical protein VG125_12140 [Pirellulales bacterium]|nr:hypothetical protein [Pirellulales bacterium]